MYSADHRLVAGGRERAVGTPYMASAMLRLPPPFSITGNIARHFQFLIPHSSFLILNRQRV